MLLRSSSLTSDKERAFDSGYRSDHDTTYEHDSVGNVCHCSCVAQSVQEHVCCTKPSHPGDTPYQKGSSGLRYDTFTLVDTPKVQANGTIEEQSDSEKDAEVCETDSEDEISQQFNMPYKSAEEFPIVPLPSTLARAGFRIAAMKAEKLHAKGNEKAQDRQQVGTSSTLQQNARGQNRAARNRESAGVLVPKQQVRYSLEDALEATEGLRHLSDGYEGESDDEYV